MKNTNLAEYLLRNDCINDQLTALTWNSITLSRSELLLNVQKTALYLSQLQIKPKQRVILCLNDTPSFFEFFLGSIAIGAIPIAINPKLDQKNLKYIIDDSQASTLIVEKKTVEQLEYFFTNCKSLTTRNNIIIQDRYTREKSEFSPEYFYPRASKIEFCDEGLESFEFYKQPLNEPCFWQYTSGTTGTPKAVVHSSEVMLKNTENFAVNSLDITKNDRLFSVAKLFFGYGLGNSLFFPLLTGAHIILEDRWINTNLLLEIIQTHQPTVLFAVPKIYALLLNQNFNANDLSSIDIFYSAGSHLNATVNKKWKSKTGRYITQGIGCTEIGHVYLSNLPGFEDPQTTGIALEEIQLKITDQNEIELKDGQTGELWVKPNFQLLGYTDESANSNKFKKNNWYKTGDRFYKNHLGQYIFQSRVDDLFKVNGRMVVPGLIENFVLGTFDIIEAVFIDLENQTTSDVDTCLCISCIKTDGNSIDKLKNKIQEAIKDEFASYMRPNFIEFFDEFPRNSNGKISRQQVKSLAFKKINQELQIS